MEQLTFDPEYGADINQLAELVRRAHGAKAMDIAAETARHHLKSSAWKNCALWLQIVNRLSVNPASFAS